MLIVPLANIFATANTRLTGFSLLLSNARKTIYFIPLIFKMMHKNKEKMLLSENKCYFQLLNILNTNLKAYF